MSASCVAQPTAMPSQRRKRSVGKPPLSVQIGFYHVPWDGKEQLEELRTQLGQDCAKAFQENDLAVLCLCDLGPNNLDKNLGANLSNTEAFQNKYTDQNVNKWLEQTIHFECCKTSKQGFEVCVVGPYAFILDKSVCGFEVLPELTDAFFEVHGSDHSYRRAAVATIHVLPDGPHIHVWVHHAPASQTRGYSPFAREATMHYFFNNVPDKGIVGGDFAMSKSAVNDAHLSWERQDLRQRCKTSDWEIHERSDAKHGDLALTRGLRATQIAETPSCTSDRHDFVVLQIDLQGERTHKRSACEPSSDARDSSVAQPAPAALRLGENYPRARKFLAALDQASYHLPGNSAQAALLRDLVQTLWYGKIMGVPKDDVQNLTQQEQEDYAIAQLDDVIKLVARIRQTWLQSHDSADAWAVPGRYLDELEGDLSEDEMKSCHNHYMNSLEWMTQDKRDKYEGLKQEQEEQNKGKGKQGKGKKGKGKKAKGKGKSKGKPQISPGQQAQGMKKSLWNVFCFQTSGSKQFLMALVRNPSFLRAQGLERLLTEWTEIKKSDDSKKAVAQSQKRTEEQTKQRAELQKLRININRLRKNGEEDEQLLQELKQKQEIYGRGKQVRPPGCYLADNQEFSNY